MDGGASNSGKGGGGGATGGVKIVLSHRRPRITPSYLLRKRRQHFLPGRPRHHRGRWRAAWFDCVLRPGAGLYGNVHARYLGIVHRVVDPDDTEVWR